MKKKPTNKTELNPADLQIVLDLHNAAKDMIDQLQDGFSCSLETASKLQEMQYKIANAFDFKPMQNETCDHPQHWADYVLPEDPKAWFSDYEQEQWETKTEKELTKCK
jgi:hypothetical protein